MRWEQAFATGVRRLAKKKQPPKPTEDRRAAVLRDIEPRVHDDFMDWMDDLYFDDKPMMEDNLADESSRHDHLADFLDEKHSIRVRPDGLIDFHTADSDTEHAIGDNPVIVYHHTSDALDRRIRKEGLKVGKKAANPYQNSRSGVYLTTESSGPAVGGYIDNAIQTHGGNPKTWGVKTTLRDLIPDPDDADIRSGLTQFYLPHVSPDDLVEE